MAQSIFNYNPIKLTIFQRRFRELAIEKGYGECSCGEIAYKIYEKGLMPTKNGKGGFISIDSLEKMLQRQLQESFEDNPVEDRHLSTKYLITYARFFGVSTDYLLGISNIMVTHSNFDLLCKNSNIKTKGINKFLNHMTDLDENNNRFFFCPDALNALLESNFLYKIFDQIMLYKMSNQLQVVFREDYINNLKEIDIVSKINTMNSNFKKEEKIDLELNSEDEVYFASDDFRNETLQLQKKQARGVAEFQISKLCNSLFEEVLQKIE